MPKPPGTARPPEDAAQPGGSSARPGKSLAFDYVITTITAGVVLIAGIVVYRLASDFLGQEGFAQYALARRIISLLLPVMILGAAVAVPRAIAKSEVGGSERTLKEYLTAALCFVLLGEVLFLLVSNAWPRLFSKVLFGTGDLFALVPAIGIVLVGVSIEELCFAYFRGRLQMIQANLLQLVTFGVAPILAFFSADTVQGVLLWMGGVPVVASAGFILHGRLLAFSGWRVLSERARTLLDYGVRRIPGDFAVLGLLAVPATLTGHLSGLIEAGMVAFGTTLITLAGTVTSPLSSLLLPHATKLLVDGDGQTLKTQTNTILWVLCPLAVAGTVAGQFLLNVVTEWYLGSEYLPYLGVVRIMLIAVPPYAIFVALRSLNDAAFVRAVNTKNSIVSFAFSCTIAALSFLFYPDLNLLLGGFVAGIYLLAGLTVYSVYKGVFTSHQ